ncbi:type III-B CRISPR module RAMP protein Cmr4 [Clostridium botulinum]|nr:type III-B CRISPR module RAMP protein Cmr4 [Clostridium botulinum]NFD32106.1 type III-B CRISPR module RAMP protein Cmr4 [Clostridium botulinum]NFD58013.1 type III-B CRISPR module RAMP protein Cmr4 [Clostridium botulinum]NFD99967.1 type III-B CRISPR module RAMP protein Cmr4 [Clostridium botulinum]
MFKGVNKILIKAITPVHAGVGRALGLIDMPIQKEKHTGIPKIEGSTMKGSMRESYRLKKDKEKNNEDIVKKAVDKLFGPEDGNESAGIIGFTDAKLLFYPVITLDGIFAYVTCSYLLNRYFEDKALINNIEFNNKFKDLLEGECEILNNKCENIRNKIILDEYYFQETDKSNRVYEGLDLREFNLNSEKQVAVISDDDFIEIISLCREVITRNRINPETGVVDTGSLFTEEYLPAESILYTLVLQNGIEDKGNLYDTYIKNDLPNYAQIGGNATIGKGIVKITKLTESSNSQGGESNVPNN